MPYKIINEDKISFREQMIECKEKGLTAPGPILDYKFHPNWLPLDPQKRQIILESERGLPLIKCLRFGGVCHSGKKKCQELRIEKYGKYTKTTEKSK